MNDLAGPDGGLEALSVAMEPTNFSRILRRGARAADWILRPSS
jgi:hypothetical protein